MEDIAGRIEREVASWEGVTTHAHRFGGVEFRLGRREIGHLHGERWADLPFQKGIRDMLVETGRAQPHHVLPETGWVSRQIRSDEDVGRGDRALPPQLRAGARRAERARARG